MSIAISTQIIVAATAAAVLVVGIMLAEAHPLR